MGVSDMSEDGELNPRSERKVGSQSHRANKIIFLGLCESKIRYAWRNDVSYS